MASARGDLIEQRARDALSGFNERLSATGEGAFGAFFALPGAQGWCPPQLLLGERSFIFDIGLPLSLIRHAVDADAHLAAVSSAVAKNSRPDPKRWSEIQVAALMAHWKGSVRFLSTSSRRTADVEAHWGQSTVDVEVTRADARQHHVAAQRGLELLATTLEPQDVQHHVICFLADASSELDLGRVLDAAIEISSTGGERGEGDRWAVRAVQFNRREEVVGADAVRTFAPSWWRADAPSYFSSATLLSADGVSPVIALRSAIPATSLIGPIRRKAERPQGRSGRPFLIAVDVTEFPGAHSRLPVELKGWFEGDAWDHVSGVLLFDARFYIGVRMKEWATSLHVNPGAKYQLPSELMAVGTGAKHLVQFDIAG